MEEAFDRSPTIPSEVRQRKAYEVGAGAAVDGQCAQLHDDRDLEIKNDLLGGLTTVGEQFVEEFLLDGIVLTAALGLHLRAVGVPISDVSVDGDRPSPRPN